jgi:hypothetical protein
VYKKWTWGSYGQHSNLYAFVLQDGKWESAWSIAETRWEDNSSRKNTHKLAYVKKSALKGKIIKEVKDYQSSGRRDVEAKYYYIDERGNKKELKSESGLRDEKGFYTKVELPNGKILIDRKDYITIK